MRLATKEEAERVIKDPEMYSRISDELCPDKENFQLPDIPYIGFFLDDIVGLAVVHPFKDGQKLHFMVLKPYRKLAREFLYRLLPILKQPVYADIPKEYQSVINFAKKSGFVESGGLLKWVS